MQAQLSRQKNPPKNKKIVGQILASVLLIKQIHTEFWLNNFKNCLNFFEKQYQFCKNKILVHYVPLQN